MIKLGKLADAKAVLDQAKSKGAKGDGFDKLEQRLQEAIKSIAQMIPSLKHQRQTKQHFGYRYPIQRNWRIQSSD